MKIILIDINEFPYDDLMAKDHDFTRVKDITIQTLNRYLDDLSKCDIILISHGYAARHTNIIQAIKDLREADIKGPKVAPIIIFSVVRRLNSDNAIHLGADSYITIDKPDYLFDTLRGYANAQATTDFARYSLRTMNETKIITDLIASQCPNPMMASLGISELLLNAIEHGNLSLHTEEKMQLLADNIWLEEVDRRIQLEGNKNKFVDITYEKIKEELHVTVTDMGEGFNWQGQALDEIEKNTHQSGRGIGIATQISFKELKYVGTGNQVVGIVDLTKKL